MTGECRSRRSGGCALGCGWCVTSLLLLLVTKSARPAPQRGVQRESGGREEARTASWAREPDAERLSGPCRRASDTALTQPFVWPRRKPDTADGEAPKTSHTRSPAAAAPRGMPRATCDGGRYSYIATRLPGTLAPGKGAAPLRPDGSGGGACARELRERVSGRCSGGGVGVSRDGGGVRVGDVGDGGRGSELAEARALSDMRADSACTATAISVCSLPGVHCGYPDPAASSLLVLW